MASMAGFSKQDRGYFLDSLEVVFTILDESLPGISVAVYLHEEDEGHYIFQGSNISSKAFRKSVQGDIIPEKIINGESGENPSTMVLSGKETDHFLTRFKKVQDAVVAVRPLLVGKDSAGLLVIVAQEKIYNEVRVQRNIELAARILQNSLVLKSELDATYAENSFLSDLVNQAGNLDISSKTEVLTDTLVRLVKGVLTYDRLTISTQAADSQNELEIDTVDGLKDSYRPGFTYNISGVAHGEVFKQAQPINIHRLDASKYKGRFKPGDFKDTKLNSFLGVPIMEAASARGTVALESKSKNHFRTTDMGILKAIIQVYGTALCWSKRYREIHDMATIDGLTQLLNHRSFMERFGIEVERAMRYNETIAFFMLDLDHFKLVNDTYGHLFGDYVLWQTAQLIRSCIRKPDIAGRYGGEEFGVIILNADKETSRPTAERIRKSIADFRFMNKDTEVRVTASIGVSEYPTDGLDINTLVRCADDAMYMVKHRGGNAVIAYSEEPDDEEKKGQ